MFTLNAQLSDITAVACIGLTSRPLVGRGAQAKEASPYTLLNQARLALQLPQVLGLSKVLYAGHGDGALLAVMASGLALR